MVQPSQTGKIQSLFGLVLGIPLAYLVGLFAVRASVITLVVAAGIAVTAYLAIMFSNLQRMNRLSIQRGQVDTNSNVQEINSSKGTERTNTAQQQKPFFVIRLLAFVIIPMIALSRELNLAGLPIRPEDLLLVLLVVLWLLQQLSRPQLWPQTSITKPIFVLIGVELVSTLLGALMGTTTLSVTNPYSGTFFWLKNVEVFFLFFIITSTLPTLTNVRVWVYLLALSGTALGTWGMTNHLAGNFPEIFIPDPDGGATYSLLALALLTPICLGVALVVLSSHQWVRLFWLGALLPMGYSYLNTFSRQAYIGLGAALIFLVYRLQWRAIPLVIAVVVTLIYITPKEVAERANTIFDPFHSTTDMQAFTTAALHRGVYGTRYRAWIYRLPEVLTQNPITGLGSAAMPPGNLDNQYLAVLYYNGLLGLSVFLWLLWSTAQLGWKLYQQVEIHPHIRALGLALTLATIGLVVAGFGGMPFIAIRARQMFWVLAGIAAAAEQHFASVSVQAGIKTKPSPKSRLISAPIV